MTCIASLPMDGPIVIIRNLNIVVTRRAIASNDHRPTRNLTIVKNYVVVSSISLCVKAAGRDLFELDV